MIELFTRPTRRRARAARLAAVLAAALGAASALPLHAQPTEAPLDPLLSILVRKGVLTDAEARQVQAEAETERRAAATQLTDQVKAQVIAAPELKPAVPVKFDMGKGVTFGTAGQHSMNLSGRLQARYDAAEPEAKWSFFRTSRGRDHDSFTSRRVRFKFAGNAFPHVEYEFQADATEATTILKDARISLNYFDGQFRQSFGQFKAPFSREELTSSGAQQFVDRSILNGFTPARDVGVMLDGRVAKNRVYWAAGVFNGTGEDSLNESNGFLQVARIQFDPLGAYPMSMSDFDRSATAKLAIGVNYARSDDETDAFPRTIKGDKDMWGADFAWKYKGWSAEAEYLRARYDPTDTTVPEFDMTSWRAQIGYMVTKHFEIAARWAEVSAEDDNAFFAENRGGTPAFRPHLENDTARTVGLGWYWNGHGNKLQLDYSWIEENYFDPTVSELDDDVLRVQYQIIF